MANESTFSGPHVQAALLCEKVLVEPGNVPTFVRVVDRFNVPKISGAVPPGVQVPPQVVQATLVVMLKSGDLGAGQHQVTIRLQKPDQTRLPDATVPVFFQGPDDNGAMIALPIMLATPEEGLHWFEVFFEGALITRVPMRILFQPAQLLVQGPEEGH